LGGDWRRTVIILTLVQFFMRIAITSIKPFIPLYLPELGVHVPAQIAFWTGVVTSVNFMAQIFTQPLWGSLSDRYGFRIMVIRSVFFVGFFNLIIVLAASVYELMLLRFLMGLMSGFAAASMALVAAVCPKEKLGYSVGLLQSGLMAGTIIGPGVGGVLAEFVGYRGIFFFVGALSLSMVPLVRFGIKQNPGDHGQRMLKDLTSYIGQLRGVKKMSLFPLIAKGFIRLMRMANPLKNFIAVSRNHPMVFVAIIIIICAQFGTQSSDALVALFVRLIYPGEYLNLIVALTFGLSAAASLIAAPLFGAWGDKHNHKFVLYFSLTGMALTVGLQSLCQNIMQLIILRTLSGLFAAGILPNANAIIGNSAKESGRGYLFGVVGSATAIGNLAGPFIGGIIGAALGVKAVFWVTGVILLITEVYTIIYRKLRCKD